MPEDWEKGGFGLYVHWPFCQAKCPYCDFNSHVVARIDQQAWLDAYICEIDRLSDLTSDKVLHSIFFGGGTPSLMEPFVVAGVIAHAQKRWRWRNDVEVTLEANPTSVEAQRFLGYRAAGVNRVSMGVQSLRDADLRALGRLHSASEAAAAFKIARQTFEQVSFDLIYARQNQTLEDWRVELSEALDLAVDHLSLYQLTIEDGTAFGDRFSAGKLRGLPDDDRAADMYALTQELCAGAGLPAYEVSNHARAGAESAHNKVYWKCGDYAGIGPGAHGRLTITGRRYATETIRAPLAWLNAVQTHGSGESLREALSTSEQASEFLLMGLRLAEGVDMTRFPQLLTSRFHQSVDGLVALDLVRFSDDRLVVTSNGRPLLNAILRDLLGED